MLKHTIVCVMFVAASAMAWDTLPPVPAPADVEPGVRITWGFGLVWGMFPTSDSDETYVEYYNPNANPPQWGKLDESMETAWLGHTSLTFQWTERPNLYGIGADIDGDAKLYWYSVYDDQWEDDDIEDFSLDNGTCITYVPNLSYDVWDYPVPGWIYCLPGGGTSFWRYHIGAGSFPDISFYGYYPGPNATIADQTPPFQWSPYAQPTQYRIQVAVDQYFMNNVIDTVISIPQFEPTAELDNNMYFWRSATWTSGAWSWSGSHTFVLQGGWEERYSIPASVGTGAAMAYDGDAFDNVPVLIALRGGNHKDFYAYDIEGNQWDTLDDAPVNVKAGTSITTHDPTGEWAAYPCAVFGDSDTSECPYHYYTDGDSWVPFDTTDNDPLWYSHFPEHIGSDASMVAGVEHMIYLVVGDGHFYRLEPPAEPREGGQASVMRNGKVNAHVVYSFNGIEVEYQLPASARVRAILHDALGRQVSVLNAGEQKVGVHRLSWDRDREGRRLSSGAYFLLLDTGTEQVRLKAVVK